MGMGKKLKMYSSQEKNKRKSFETKVDQDQQNSCSYKSLAMYAKLGEAVAHFHKENSSK